MCSTRASDASDDVSDSRRVRACDELVPDEVEGRLAKSCDCDLLTTASDWLGGAAALSLSSQSDRGA